jgi:hypothetical protein
MPVSQSADPTAGIAPALRDGYEVHRAALGRGLDGLLLPRQVLTVTPADGTGELAFVHGIPQSSTLSGVTYAQDKRMRRDLLAGAGLPVPPGATFAIGRELSQAREFARSIGYPVVVKPAVGDNMAEVHAGLRDESQLDAAIDYLRTPELERPAFQRAAYALTLLLEPVEEDGRAVAPAGYQFLVERHVSGRYLRLLVQADRVISAVACLDGPDASSSDSYRDVTGELHPSLGALAVDAVRAVPGLAVAAVDVVVADHRRATADQQPWIVDLSERPLLAVQARLSEELSRELGDAILTGHAAESGVALGAPRDEVTIAFQVEGATDPDGVATAISAAAAEAGLTSEASVSDPVEGTARGTLQGDPAPIAGMFERLLDGQLHGQRAMLVEARHQKSRPA